MVTKRVWFPYVYLNYSESWTQMSNRHYTYTRFLLCHALAWRLYIYFSTCKNKYIELAKLFFNSLPLFFHYFTEITLLDWKFVFDLTRRLGEGPTCICTQEYVYGAVSGVCIGNWKWKTPYLHFFIPFTKSQLQSKTTLIIKMCH